MYTLYKHIIIVAILCSGFTSYAQEILTKNIKKTFDMTNTGELLVDNKYGNVSFTGWDKNKVAITINIKVTHKKKETAKTLLERIDIETKKAGDFVSLTSTISDESSSFFSRYFNKVNPFEFDKSNVDINYTIHLPINAEIIITNKFGDISMDNWTGKLKANIEHGDLWVNDSIANANIDMKFGKLRSKSISYGTINLKNGDIDIKTSKNLLLNTSGTNIDLENATDVEITSSKDNINIQSIKSIKGELKYSNVKIETLESFINLNMRVAELRVSHITKSDPEVTINQESSDIYIGISNLSFNFDALLEEGLFRIPKTVSKLKNTLLDKDDKIRNITGSYGSSYPGTFKLKGKKGIIILEE
jgi:hypothetical protein